MPGQRKFVRQVRWLAFLLVLGCIALPAWAQASDPLPSWAQQEVKQKILKFVAQVTDSKSPAYVPPADRVATFDNDGTLWAEKPQYIPFMFELDYVYQKAAKNPSLRSQQPYKAVYTHKLGELLAMGLAKMIWLMEDTHKGESVEEYAAQVRAYLHQAKHPRYKKPYIKLTYLPMRELVRYLQKHDFKVFIVTGGGLGFVRAVSPEIYNIPVENVVGSYVKYIYRQEKGKNWIERGDYQLMNDGLEKPANIQFFIGKRPILACGNSDGDLPMLYFADGHPRVHLSLLVHHDDAQREYAYDKGAEKVLKTAREKGWQVISMKRDFKKVFAFEK
jgi:phosphoserine phosphatase